MKADHFLLALITMVKMRAKAKRTIKEKNINFLFMIDILIR